MTAKWAKNCVSRIQMFYFCLKITEPTNELYMLKIIYLKFFIWNARVMPLNFDTST